METTLTIKVGNVGTANGTLGWFNSILKDSELVIRKTRDGIPGMFLHKKLKRDGSENKENEGNTFLCCPASGTESDEGFNLSRINGIEYIYVRETGDLGQKYLFGEDFCFTGYPLTPACEVAIGRFLNDAVEKFAEWYEAN